MATGPNADKLAVTRGGGIDNVVEDTTPQLGGDLESNGNNIHMADGDQVILGTDTDGILQYIPSQDRVALGGPNLLLSSNHDIALNPSNGFIAYTNSGLEPVFFYGRTVYFFSNGSFIKANYPGLRAVNIKVQGGGGAGGGAPLTGSGQTGGGNGGGGGGYAEAFVLASSLSSSETVTVGAGGTGNSGATGGDGGDSSFGSHCFASGGDGAGVVGASATINHGSSSSNAMLLVGDLGIPGGVGGGAMRYASNRTLPGRGGNSFMGQGGGHVPSNTAGDDGRSYGGGGGGASATSSNVTALAGGAGGDGIVIVELYY